jgi:SAM-dependent methyltransferase
LTPPAPVEIIAAVTEARIDYGAVRRYWDEAATQALAASYMAHEQGLPEDCVRYRFERESAVVDRWFSGLGTDASILDLGCGSGTWSRYFAALFRRVVAVESSAGMFEAATRALADCPNVDLVRADAVALDLDERFDGVFIGGLLMYLNRDDVASLLRRLPRLLKPGGRVVIRESTVRTGVEARTGEYQVVYRSPAEYASLIEESSLALDAIEPNRGYEAMEVAVEIVNTVRALPLLRRARMERIGTGVWRFLGATQPVSLRLAPAALSRLGVAWPHLQNHFFLVCAP